MSTGSEKSERETDRQGAHDHEVRGKKVGSGLISRAREGATIGVYAVTCVFFLGSCGNAGVGSSAKPAPCAWITSADGSRLLAEEPLSLRSGKSGTLNVISLDARKKYQSMDGFGASLTESSGYAISTLSEAERDALLVSLFENERGIGVSFLRQPMGSPDFALSPYSYDDLEPGETDFDLARFSIDRDRKYIIPYLKRALAINPAIKVMATPWSPPAWMKKGRSLMGAEGGSLRSDCYAVYADYFIRFIRAYEAEGIPIYAVTPQNEINYAPAQYSGMKLSPAEEALFIGSYLGPTFEREGIRTKIFCYDHNWDHPEMAAATLSDPGAAKYLAGSAWHYYAGSPDAMSAIHDRFPDKEIWFTEGGSGKWIGKGTFSATFRDGMEKGIGITRNWAKSIVWWNVALDGNNGPIVFPNTANYGLVGIRVDPATGSGVLMDDKRASWYTLAHFSRFVSPGAVRVASGTRGLDLSQVAFVNPDGSRVLVVYNRFAYTCDVAVRVKGGLVGSYVRLKLPEFSATTVVLPAE